MPLVIISGHRGGTGATTVVSNLAAALQRTGLQTLSIDLHPDNQLSLHYGVDQQLMTGWAQTSVSGADWKQCGFQAADGRRVLPFGDVPPYQYAQFRDGLRETVSTMADTLSSPTEDWLLFDMPVIRHHALADNVIADVYARLIALADINLHVISPDLGCYRLLKQAALNGDALSDKQFYLVNGADTHSPLSLDIALLLESEFSNQVLPVSIHKDTAVAEAAAHMTSVNAYMPDSQAADDFHALALWSLGRVGKGSVGA